MNQETVDFSQNKHTQKQFNVPFSCDLQILNIHNTNLKSNHNEYMQYNLVPILQYSIDQNPTVFHPNFLIPNFNAQYIKNQKKKPIYKPHCKWSKEEDEKLKELVKEYGEKDWRHLAKKFEGRNSRQCRERWNYYLNPKLKQGQWTIEEDQMILNKYQEHGPKWMEITKYFEYRTDSMIKNRFNYLIRKQKRNKKVFYNVHSYKHDYKTNSKPDENLLKPSDSYDSNQSDEFPSFLPLEQNFLDYSSIDNELKFCNLNESLFDEMSNFGDYFNE